MDHKKLKEAFDQIEVPDEEVFRAIDRGIRKNSQQRTSATQKKKIMVSSIIAASVCGLTLFSGFINSNMNKVLADAPVIGGIYEKFGDKTGLDLNQQHLVTELNQSITQNDVYVKLNSVYFDGDVVSVTGHVGGDLSKGTNEEGELSFDVNFEDHKGDDDSWLSGKEVDYKAAGNGYDFQWKLAYPYKEIKENFTLPISIHNINGIEGSWNFDVPVAQQQNKALIFNQSKEYQNENIRINMDELRLAKASSTMLFETISPYQYDQIDVEKAVDDKGKVLFHYANNTILTKSKEKDKYHTTFRKSLGKIDKDLKAMTIYPVLNIADPPVQNLLNTSSFTLNSKRTDLGIEVNNVVQEDNRLILNYQFKGMPKNISKHQLELMVHNLSYTFTLVDKEYADKIDPKNPVPPANHSISRNQVKLLNKENLHFQSVFQLYGEEKIEDFSLPATVLQVNFSSFIEPKKLEPFTVHLEE